METARRSVMLCADDFALTEGVSRGVMDLAERGRLSATGAMVNTVHWSRSRGWMPGLRRNLAVGLHLNLTHGAPLGAMPALAPGGRFPSLPSLILRALAGQLRTSEIADEIDRQLDRFEDVAGAAPDFIDGHHHIQVLKPVRLALGERVQRRYGAAAPLVRCPTDDMRRIVRRGGAMSKALFVAWLGHGARRDYARAAIPTNEGFAGFSTFDENRPFNLELDGFLAAPGRRHLIMCHPGYPDAELRALDPLSDRRLAELTAIAERPDLAAWLWRPSRNGAGRIDWEGLGCV